MFELFYMLNIRNEGSRDFPGGPVVRALHLTAGGTGSVFGWETKIPLLHSTTEKQREREMGWGGDACAYIRLQNVESVLWGRLSSVAMQKTLLTDHRRPSKHFSNQLMGHEGEVSKFTKACLHLLP